MAKKKRDEEGGYNFMDTYGDMMTLLLTFFILLFSMSTVDSEKWEILVKAFARNKDANTSQIVMIPEGDGDDVASANGEFDLKSEVDGREPEAMIPAEFSELAEMIQQYLEQNQMEDSVSMETVGDNAVYLTFDNNLFFDGDSYVLRQSSYDILNFLGGLFRSVEDEILLIRINGHTAAVPGMDNYSVNDWDLSSLRANRVATYFEENVGIQPKKLMTNGYGKNHPVATNETSEGRAANRRVDIQILGNDFDKSNPEELLNILQQTLDVKLFDDTQPEEEAVTPPDTPNLVEPDGEQDDSTPSGASGSVSEGDGAAPASSQPASPPPAPTDVDQAQVDAAMEELIREAGRT